MIDGKKILAGNARFVGTKSVNKDGTVVYVSIDGEFAGYIVISDEIKEDAHSAVSDLKKMGIATEMLSGDTYKTAVSVQQTLGLDKVYAELLPEDKVNKLEELITNSSGSVIFAGDQWLELTATGFRLKGEVASYSARGWFGQVSFPSTDEFYYTLTGEQESDLQVYWQDNTLRIVSESPGEVTLHLKDLRDTYQFPAGGCVITDFADGKIIVK